MHYPHLEGLIAAPFSPMHADGSLNLSVIKEYYRLLKDNGVNGAFICGSTGEGVSLTMEEKKLVAEAWASAAKDDPSFHIIQLVGGTCVADCKVLARHAHETELYAVAYMAPFYFKPTEAQTLADIGAEIAAVVPDMPVYYYHIPVLTGVHINMIDLLKKVDGRIPNFAGIKFTHEDFDDFEACMNYADGKFDMLWGRDETWLSALQKGAIGAVGSTFNYAAPIYYQITDAYKEGNLKAAEKLQAKAVDMIDLLGKYGGIATGKAYMKYLGLDCGTFRLPIVNMHPTVYSEFVRDVGAIDFDQFCSKLPQAIKIGT